MSAPPTHTHSVRGAAVPTAGIELLSLLVSAALVVGVYHLSAPEAAPHPEPRLLAPAITPRVVVDPGVPDHYARRARELWPRLLEAFPHQAGTCLRDVRIEFLDERRLVGHGYYTPSTATVVVRPTAHITELLLHELGHHLDLSCGAEREIGEEFRAAMALGEDPWYVSETGVAEVFAEAVRAYLEGRSHPAGDLLHRWAAAGGETAVRPTKTTAPPPADFPVVEWGP